MQVLVFRKQNSSPDFKQCKMIVQKAEQQQYREDMAELYYEIMPESTNDDALCADFDQFEHTNMMTGAMKVAAQAGVVIYDSKW